MKKSISSILLASALLLGSIAPVAANAATNTGSMTGKTTGSISFNKPAATTDPVDPDNPGTTDPGDKGGVDVDPDNPAGDLALLYVSNGINFGTHDVSTQTTKATAESIDNTRSTGTGTAIANNKNLLTEVTDTRGTNAGWSISLSADPMTVDGKTDSTSNGDNTLKGALLNLNSKKAATIKSSSDTESGITQSAVTDMTTDGTSTQPIYGAKENSGMLTTTFQMDPGDIQLSSIPANVKGGVTYSGNINWTLSDTPAE
ncbi:WxL domain-containing protein [Levilactobacillus suantsaiihabitans]|uniref:WxL domain-containing protein n=1 Tax=Levilactobacillus suantsaiihabitans TaxID=2487722 RepID=A0A4Z0JDH1_9LACO|nr:WxL domain-containing protein [Levilactobacillus suantsaiihabitans]TGD19729.1 WxL domain-containing protein [Levilactobacillus suantsaiihabitans]